MQLTKGVKSRMRAKKMKRRGQRGLGTPWVVVVSMLFVSTLGAGIVWLSQAAPSNAAPALSSKSAPAGASTSSTTAAPANRNIDWDRPLSGTNVDSSDQAGDYVSFTPLVPKGLGKPQRIMVDSASRDHAGRTVALVYQHPVYGRFFVIESKSSMTQASLEGLAGCDHATGCVGEWTLVRLRNGANGLLITGGPTTGIIWLSQGFMIDIMGPIDTFSVADAIRLANAM